MININYPSNLPVSQVIPQIKELIMQNQVVIICGETGSGKTTQLPKVLYELGLVKNEQIIGHTQPRRVAAKSIARRIGEELNNHDVVGYKIRFHDRTKATTCIKLMTDGILLQEIQNDRYLRRYSALIIDEAHERSLNIDFILGYLKIILPKRPDLKIIITSATIDNEKLSEFFNNAPIIDVEGKTYPVDIIYAPLDAKNNVYDINRDNKDSKDNKDNIADANEASLNVAIYNAIESCFAVDVGNILIFLPGEREIKECIRFLQKTNLRQCQLLALYSRQNELEQNLIFKDDGALKIIVTTNVAETSLTIPGVKFVIDSGLARVKRYSTRYKVEQLQIENIAQANSRQRAGRAGRLSHGMCIRLFAEDDFKLRKVYPDPEVLRSNLANVILKLMSFKLGDPLTFPFLDRPVEGAFNDGFKTLYQLNAIDKDNRFTKIGIKLGMIPIDVNLARMLVAAGYGVNGVNCLTDVLIIVAFLAVSDPREVPFEHQQLATMRHSIWADKTSDFIAVLNLWHWYMNELELKKSKKQILEHCRYQFVSAIKLREWHELHGQLKEVMHNLGYLTLDHHINMNTIHMTSPSIIHQALLTGMLNNMGQKDLVENYYNGVNGKKFYLHPSSSIDKKVKGNIWLCSANLVQTNKLYARTNAIINPEWLIPITKHVVKYTFDLASWDKKRGEVTAIQSTLLYGLIINKKRVTYSNIDPVVSREIFIRQGMVPTELGANYHYPFLQHNTNVLAQLDKLEDKFRMTTIMVDEELFDFYDKLVPQDICDIRSFDKWYSGLDNSDVGKLKLQYKTLVAKFAQTVQHVSLYPDFIMSGGNKIKLKYVFDPTKSNDGVTAVIYLNQLLSIDESIFTWLVSGLIRDKLTYIIKSLPKAIRVRLNPITEFTTKFLEQNESINAESISSSSRGLSLATTLANYVQQYYQLKLTFSEIEEIERNQLPTHLRCHFQIVDVDSKTVLLDGDDLVILKNKLSTRLHNLVTQVSSEHEVLDIKNWEPALANLLQEVNLHKINGYFSLTYDAKRSTVNLFVCDSLEKAIYNTKIGFYYLTKLQMTEHIKYIFTKKWANFKQTTLCLANIYTSEQLLADGVEFILRKSINVSKIIKPAERSAQQVNYTPQTNYIPQTIEEFDLFVSECKNQVGLNVAEFGRILFSLSELYHNINIRLKKKKSRIAEKIVLQLDDLIFPQFLRYVAWIHLVNYPRYLQAIIVRLDKYDFKPTLDTALDHEIETIYEMWYNYVDKLESQQKVVPQSLYDFKYKIEELRVSLFASDLKTAYVVSSKRLLRELENIIL
jgi:ATP-dependent helicase HrpA